MSSGLSLVTSLRRALPWAALNVSAHAAVGVQLRGDQLAYARVAFSDGAPRVDHLRWTLAESTRRFEAVRRLAHTGALRDARVRLVLAPGEYDLYQLPAPNVPDDELRDALRWQLRGTLPYAPEDAEIDFVRVPAPPSSADNQHKPTVLVVAAPRATVEQAIAPFATVGVEVDAVDVPEFAQRNLALLTPAADTTTLGCVAWLSFDHDACLLTVQTGAGHDAPGELAFTRRIHVPGANGGPTGAIETDHTVGYLIERIVTQVQRSLDVFERQSGQPAVGQMTVGPHRHGAAIARQLADRLALACRCFHPAAVLSLGDDVPGAESPAWGDALAALGVALRRDTLSSTSHAGWRAWFGTQLKSLSAARAA